MVFPKRNKNSVSPAPVRKSTGSLLASIKNVTLQGEKDVISSKDEILRTQKIASDSLVHDLTGPVPDAKQDSTGTAAEKEEGVHFNMIGSPTSKLHFGPTPARKPEKQEKVNRKSASDIPKEIHKSSTSLSNSAWSIAKSEESPTEKLPPSDGPYLSLRGDPRDHLIFGMDAVKKNHAALQSANELSHPPKKSLSTSSALKKLGITHTSDDKVFEMPDVNLTPLVRLHVYRRETTEIMIELVQKYSEFLQEEREQQKIEIKNTTQKYSKVQQDPAILADEIHIPFPARAHPQRENALARESQPRRPGETKQLMVKKNRAEAYAGSSENDRKKATGPSGGEQFQQDSSEKTGASANNANEAQQSSDFGKEVHVHDKGISLEQKEESEKSDQDEPTKDEAKTLPVNEDVAIADVLSFLRKGSPVKADAVQKKERTDTERLRENRMASASAIDNSIISLSDESQTFLLAREAAKFVGVVPVVVSETVAAPHPHSIAKPDENREYASDVIDTIPGASLDELDGNVSEVVGAGNGGENIKTFVMSSSNQILKAQSTKSDGISASRMDLPRFEPKEETTNLVPSDPPAEKLYVHGDVNVLEENTESFKDVPVSLHSSMSLKASTVDVEHSTNLPVFESKEETTHPISFEEKVYYVPENVHRSDSVNPIAEASLPSPRGSSPPRTIDLGDEERNIPSGGNLTTFNTGIDSNDVAWAHSPPRSDAVLSQPVPSLPSDISTELLSQNDTKVTKNDGTTAQLSPGSDTVLLQTALNPSSEISPKLLSENDEKITKHDETPAQSSPGSDEVLSQSVPGLPSDTSPELLSQNDERVMKHEEPVKISDRETSPTTQLVQEIQPKDQENLGTYVTKANADEEKGREINAPLPESQSEVEKALDSKIQEGFQAPQTSEKPNAGKDTNTAPERPGDIELENMVKPGVSEGKSAPIEGFGVTSAAVLKVEDSSEDVEDHTIVQPQKLEKEARCKCNIL